MKSSTISRTTSSTSPSLPLRLHQRNWLMFSAAYRSSRTTGPIRRSQSHRTQITPGVFARTATSAVANLVLLFESSEGAPWSSAKRYIASNQSNSNRLSLFPILLASTRPYYKAHPKPHCISLRTHLSLQQPIYPPELHYGARESGTRLSQHTSSRNGQSALQEGTIAQTKRYTAAE